MIREATIDDLDSVVALTKADRELRARLHGDYWPPAKGADELHARYLEFMLKRPDLDRLALEKNGRVIGFATVQPRPSFWFIDDICLADDADWSADGTELLQAIEQRPAIATVAHGDTALVDAALDNGLTLVASHRLFQLSNFPPVDVGRSEHASTDLPEPPLHVFIPLMDQQSTTLVHSGDGGYAVCSQSITPPPILDIGGTTAVIDRVIGKDRRATLEKSVSFLKKRGDVGAILIVAVEDHELSAIADSMGASHPVDVLRWPR